MARKNQYYPSVLKCRLCGKTYSHLGSHITHSHGLTAKDYKEMFGLTHNTALINRTVFEKKSKHFAEHRQKYLGHFLLGKGHRFKKGNGSYSVKGYISPQQKREQMQRIVEYNRSRKPESCPVCRAIFENLDSHMFNKHKLLRVKNV